MAPIVSDLVGLLVNRHGANQQSASIRPDAGPHVNGDAVTVLDEPQAAGITFPQGFDAILDPAPLQYLDEHGALVGGVRDDAPELQAARLLAAYRAMVVGRRFDV